MTKLKGKQLKEMIRHLVEQAVQPKVGPGGAYIYKEHLMQMVQSELKSLAKGGTITSQEQYVAACEDVLTKIRSDFDLTFSMIERTLKQVPFQAFISEAKRQAVQNDSTGTRKTK